MGYNAWFREDCDIFSDLGTWDVTLHIAHLRLLVAHSYFSVLVVVLCVRAYIWRLGITLDVVPQVPPPYFFTSGVSHWLHQFWPAHSRSTLASASPALGFFFFFLMF